VGAIQGSDGFYGSRRFYETGVTNRKGDACAGLEREAGKLEEPLKDNRFVLRLTAVDVSMLRLGTANSEVCGRTEDGSVFREWSLAAVAKPLGLLHFGGRRHTGPSRRPRRQFWQTFDSQTRLR